LNDKTLSLMFSSKTGEWETPPEVFRPLDKEFHFTLDVCATPQNAKVSRFFTKADDGLTRDWSRDICWMNPPYGRVIGDWIKKAYEESLKGATVVCLLPARTDTKWFHELILGKAEIRFVKGRIAFLGEGKVIDGRVKLADFPLEKKSKNMPFAAPFPSMIVIFRPKV